MSSRRGDGECHKWIMANIAHEGSDCLPWPFGKCNGYGVFGHLSEIHYAHRYICELVNGPPPTDDHEAAHSCGLGHDGCVNRNHLSWKTPSENQEDRVLHGRKSTGPKGKLSPEQAVEIRALKGKIPQREIAKLFGCSRSNISFIHCGKAWNGPNKFYPNQLPA